MLCTSSRLLARTSSDRRLRRRRAIDCGEPRGYRGQGVIVVLLHSWSSVDSMIVLAVLLVALYILSKIFFGGFFLS